MGRSVCGDEATVAASFDAAMPDTRTRLRRIKSQVSSDFTVGVRGVGQQQVQQRLRRHRQAAPITANHV